MVQPWASPCCVPPVAYLPNTASQQLSVLCITTRGGEDVRGGTL